MLGLARPLLGVSGQVGRPKRRLPPVEDLLRGLLSQSMGEPGPYLPNLADFDVFFFLVLMKPLRKLEASIRVGLSKFLFPNFFGAAPPVEDHCIQTIVQSKFKVVSD